MIKRFVTIVVTMMFFVIGTIYGATTVNAFEEQPLEIAYDFNGDHKWSVKDAIMAQKLVDEGKLSSADLELTLKLVLGEDIEVEFQEFDIDDLTVSEQSIFTIQAACESYCIGYEFDGTSVRYRFLNDGMITELRCSNISPAETLFEKCVYDGVMNFIGISEDGRFVIDSVNSFDLPHEVVQFEEWDLDDTTPEFAEYLLRNSGRFLNFEVENSNSGTTSVRFFFDNGFKRTVLALERITPIEYEICDFVYENEIIRVGVNGEGKIALDTYSFDIANFDDVVDIGDIVE